MRLKDLREDNDFTQYYVAEYLCIKQNTYSQYENGKWRIPLKPSLSRVERVFFCKFIEYFPHKMLKNNITIEVLE